MTDLLASLDRLARSPSRRLLVVLLAWVVGITLASNGVRPPFAFASTSCVAVASTVILLSVRRSRTIASVALLIICASVASLGAIRFTDAERAIAPFPTSSYLGTVASDPDHGIRGITIRIDHVTDERSRRLPVHAFTVRLDESENIHAGDRLAWRCNDDPYVFGTFASCDARHLTASPPRNGIDAWASSLRRRIRAAARAALPEPDSSLVLGLVVGERDGIPADVKDAYRDAGVSHVLAVSGSNVGWVVLVASYGLAAACIRRRRMLARLLLAVVGFAVLVGGDPPVVRAAIVASAALIGEAVGRKGNTPIALAIAAAAMLAHDPLLIRDSVAFRLSFVAVIGLHALAGPLEREMTVVPKRLGLRRALAETTAASLATLPIVLHDFGRFPTATLLANAVVVPVMPALVGVGALALAAAAFWSPLALPFATVFSLASRALNATIAAIVRTLPAFDLRIGVGASYLLYASLTAFWFTLRARARSRQASDDL